ncbi:MAG: molybdenum cofactor guanylyltransferase [Algibacter sp.]|uniref:molybdenum cofactor guanylyltransferase n=1 Tax=Algibacter sp. TaxID=1872428 RepID=UPI002636D8FD|nr:molybdenum cofactor guanylyltransferase [Algibacter sp.]MDG1731076.1 molybdenum cofactor guanylyltransferase [Algibacter sp.]MDG2178403.1 molybdenum cofactor guanylyltransferase [Algibacter sp.]
MVDKKNITGIILAGGKSSRMGTDKGFLLLNDKPFVQYSIDALQPLVSEIIIVSDDSKYDIFGLKRVDDITKNAGPVAGICSGLEASFSEYNIILSCDVPLITSKILQKLIDAIDDTSEIIQVESKGKTMPLIALYKKQIINTFKTLLQEDERRLRVAIMNCISKNIVLEKKQEFSTMNVNTQTELKAIENANYY